MIPVIPIIYFATIFKSKLDLSIFFLLPSRNNEKVQYLVSLSEDNVDDQNTIPYEWELVLYLHKTRYYQLLFQ